MMTVLTSPLRLAGAAALACSVSLSAPATAGDGEQAFARIATIPVFLNTDIDTETVSEIVDATADGMLLAYTDGANGQLGFIDISDPENPTADGVVDLGGEPTSVAIVGDHALVGINTSPDFVNPSGELKVVEISSRTVVRTIDMGGQPDSVAVSPDGQYGVVVIENERDEDLGNGEPPQAPAGFVVIVDLVGAGPADWTTRAVSLDGVPDLFPDDAEPEYVDVNALNQAVVTLQENNHLAIIDLATGTVTADFSCGTVDLENVDTLENDLIEQTSSLTAVPREPDAVTWITDTTFATADEGDLFGGSRGFTIFSTDGTVLFGSGNELEHLTASLGHYPEGRSENKGNEPESVDFGQYGDTGYLFVGSERSSLVFVYEMVDGTPVYRQSLPTGLAPEGLKAIPSRDLFVVASEDDDRGDTYRASISIYRLGESARYPSVVSVPETEGGTAPIPWAALSGLVTDPGDDDTAFAVYDSFYQQSRWFTLDVHETPAVITGQTVLNDADGVLATALTDLAAALPDSGDLDPAAVVNSDGTVNIDPEGISAMTTGQKWIVSEGSGNLVDGVSDPKNRPFTTPNILLRASETGVIESVVLPPFDLTLNQLRFGFEGVAVDEANGYLYVAWQRAWQDAGDPADRARIGRYEPSTGEWTFAYYPLDAVESAAGGWVGLSEITRAPDGRLVVLERDNQANVDAAVKRITVFDPADVTFVPNSADPAGDFQVISKTLVRDILASGDFDAFGGLPLEKLEGLSVDSEGTVLVVNDNDGVDDNSGETLVIRLDSLLAPCLADLDGNDTVDFEDLLVLLAAWGACDDCAADLDGDGTVGFGDLLILLAAYGACG